MWFCEILSALLLVLIHQFRQHVSVGLVTWAIALAGVVSVLLEGDYERASDPSWLKAAVNRVIFNNGFY